MHPDRRSARPRALTKDYILQGYLPIFYNALLNKVDYIIHLDPFSGPGRYEDASEGSPIHALEIVWNLEKKIKKNFRERVIFIFCENNKNFYRELSEAVKPYKKEGFKIECLNENAQDVIKEIPNIVKKVYKSTKVGIFAYLDPWGLKDVAIEPVIEVLKLRFEFNIPCEILLRFPPYLVCRFYHNQKLGPDWIRKNLGLDKAELKEIVTKEEKEKDERWEKILKHYVSCIIFSYKEETKEELSCCAVETVGSGQFYYMVFFSSNEAGISHMSNTMVKAFLKRIREEEEKESLSLWFQDINPKNWYKDMCNKEYFIDKYSRYLKITPEEIEEYTRTTKTREELLFHFLKDRIFAVSHYSIEKALKNLGFKLKKEGLFCKIYC
jgi:three-Cys-motif partner protein